MKQIDDPARRAMEANVRETIFVKLRRWWDKQPPATEVLFTVFGVAFLACLSIFEATNSARGWVMLTKGAAPAALAFLAGLGATALYLVLHRQSAEELRAGNTARGYRAAIGAFVAASLSLMGVFGNIASKTSVSAATAIESNDARNAQLIRVRELERKVNTVDGPFIEAMLEADRSALRSTLAEAKGWGMENLNPDGECARDLRPRQRTLCNAANGTAGEQGLVGQIAINEAALESYEANAAALDDAQAALPSMRRAEGQAHWESMSALTQGQVGTDSFRIWGSFIASILFLVVCGIGWDYWFERIEDEDYEATS